MTHTDFHYAGSVSHGTMRDEDLIPTFLDVLRDLDAAEAEKIETEYLPVLVDLQRDEDERSDEFDAEAPECTHALFDALDALAPPGWYFGAIEGDGSDFGFWLVEEDYDVEEDEG